MHVAVLGAGAVGARAVRQLISTPAVTGVVVVDRDGSRAARAAQSMADGARARIRPQNDRWWAGADVVVLAHPEGDHGPVAGPIVADGVSVVSVSADLADGQALLALDDRAREQRCHVVAGAAFSPGLSCLLAAHAAATFDDVDEVHVARTGTGGLACADATHRARGRGALDWRDGQWRSGASGGKELCWFPEPVGALDCSPAATADALVLVPAFPGVQRVTARLASSRWDGLAGRLPGGKGQRGEGQLGAVRVEVRGRRAGRHENLVLGAVDRPAVAAGAVAAVVALSVAQGHLARHGSGGLAELAPGLGLLRELSRRGVKAAAFDPEGRARAEEKV